MDSFPYNKYCPSANASTEKPDMRVLSAQFGDGYRQTAPDGINTDIGTIDVAWNNIDAQSKDEIFSFLKSRLKLAPFLFKMPDWNKAETVYCMSVSKSDVNRYLWSITATMQRVAYLGSLS